MRIRWAVAVAVGAVAAVGLGACSGQPGPPAGPRVETHVPVELPMVTVDVEPEATYEDFLEAQGPPIEAAEGPVRVGDDVAVSVRLDDTHPDVDGWTAEWDWGDGSTSAGVLTPGEPTVVTGTHAYTDAGTYQVVATLSGEYSAITTQDRDIVVQP